MFGERRNLVLPIMTDVANLIKKNMAESMSGNYHANDKSNEDYDAATKEFHSDPQHPEQRLHRSKRSSRLSRYDDDRPSYHERKLNMTNFRGTPEANDQHAIESETRIHVSLPNSNISTAISLEEIENLAFKDLNASRSNDGKNSSNNFENLPEPQMLIRPYRVRPRPISERFDNIYLYVVDYPMLVHHQLNKFYILPLYERLMIVFLLICTSTGNRLWAAYEDISMQCQHSWPTIHPIGEHVCRKLKIKNVAKMKRIMYHRAECARA